MNVDELIDRFVERINSAPREGLFDEDVPPELRLSREAGGWWDWHIKATDGINWIEPLEDKLGIRFPLSFRSLVTRYQFPAFEAGPLNLLANTSVGVYDELRDRIFRDEILSQCLLRSGLIQFAVPDTGSYDPVCFDIRRSQSNGESPIVRIDHEAILCDEQIVVLEEMAESFAEFVATI
jgi:hypothetical protein